MIRYHSLPFGETLKMLMQQHHLTPSALGALLGEAASLRRALNENLSAAKRSEIFHSICKLSIFSAAEEDTLRKALVISELGLERHLYLKSLDDWLRITSGTLQNPSGITASFLDDFDSEWELSILCVNCLFDSVMATLRKLLQDPRRNVNIRHYVAICPPDRSISEYLRYAQNLIFDARYKAFTPGENYVGSANLPVDGNLILAKATKGSQCQERFYVVINEQDLRPFPVAEMAGMYDYYRELLDMPLAATPLLHHPEEPLDYSSTCLEFLSYEMNRKTFIFSPDMTMGVLPPNILEKAINHRQPLRLSDPVAHARLLSLHARRYEYSNGTRKERCLISSCNGIRRFLSDGRLTDHSGMLRPFLPQERITLLDTILHHVANNAKLSVYLLKDNSRQPVYQIRCQHQLSVTLHKPSQTHWQEKPYVTLNSLAFADEMMDYLNHTIIAECCHDAKESLHMIGELRDAYAATLKNQQLL